MKKLPKEYIVKEFGNFIREARERKGMIQAEVAQKVGISRGYYALIETGAREIYFTTAMKLCSALDVNFNDFAERMLKK